MPVSRKTNEACIYATVSGTLPQVVFIMLRFKAFYRRVQSIITGFTDTIRFGQFTISCLLLMTINTLNSARYISLLAAVQQFKLFSNDAFLVTSDKAFLMSKNCYRINIHLMNNY